MQSDMAGFSVIHTGNQGVGGAPSETRGEILPHLTHPLMSGAAGLLLSPPPLPSSSSDLLPVFSLGPQPCWIRAHPAYRTSSQRITPARTLFQIKSLCEGQWGRTAACLLLGNTDQPVTVVLTIYIKMRAGWVESFVLSPL